VTYPRVSIIILNWNSLKDTSECLESLQQMDYSNYEVIVVDNGSEGDDVSILRERFGDYIHIIENEKNYGFAEGSNIGIRYAFQSSNPDYILLLNGDTVVDADFLMQLVKVAESSDSIGAVQSKLIRKDNPDIIDSAGQAIYADGSVEDIGIESHDDGRFDTVHEIFGPCAAAALYRSSVLRSIGSFDERFFVTKEDVDLSWRMRLHGYRALFVPGSRVYHKRSITRSISPVTSFADVRAYYGRKNCLCLVIKYYPLSLILKFLPFLGLSLLVVVYYSLKVDHRGSLMKDLLAALKDRRSSALQSVSIREVRRKWIIPKSLTGLYNYNLLRALRLTGLLLHTWWMYVSKRLRRGIA